jgi:anti-sigma regulatory factor (Ser/Thr protein kinase)
MTIQGQSIKLLQQRISSRLEEAESLFLRIRSFTREAGLTSLSFPIELLARECVVNAIVHGNRKLADNFVEVSLRIGRKWIRLEVSDDGSGFSWQHAGQKVFTVRSCSGRGLRLCGLYADRVRFNRRGNRIELWIRRTREER